MTTTTRGGRVLNFVACYGLWIALCLFAGWVLAEIHRELILISMQLGANQWVARAVHQLSLPVLGIIWLVGIFFLEHYMRSAGPIRRMLVRAARVAGVLLVVVLLFYALTALV